MKKYDKFGRSRSEEEVILEYREEIADKIEEAREIMLIYYKRVNGKEPKNPNWISGNKLTTVAFKEVLRHLLK